MCVLSSCGTGINQFALCGEASVISNVTFMILFSRTIVTAHLGSIKRLILIPIPLQCHFCHCRIPKVPYTAHFETSQFQDCLHRAKPFPLRCRKPNLVTVQATPGPLCG